MWCIQEITPEFRKRMYKILNLYKEPYNHDKPLLGLDEKPKQLLGEKRKPIPIQPGKNEKYDYEYIRNGNANIRNHTSHFFQVGLELVFFSLPEAVLVSHLALKVAYHGYRAVCLGLGFYTFFFL